MSTTTVWAATACDNEGNTTPIVGVFWELEAAQQACDHHPLWEHMYSNGKGGTWQGSDEVGILWAQGPGRMFDITRHVLPGADGVTA